MTKKNRATGGGKKGRRDWIRTGDLYHVKVAL